MASFSLLDGAWIQATRTDGEREMVSLRQTLLEPQRYRRIDAGQAQQTGALYRLHLALLYRALLGPDSAEQAARWYEDGFPAEPIAAYLDRHADRFDLFGPQPFLQVADLDPDVVGENFRSHWTRLSTEEGSPNTTALFNLQGRPGGERRDALEPAEAARQLLTHQAFALGGLIKRFTTSARAAPVATAALFLAEGRDLHQTLALNLVTYPAEMHEHDLPPWERPPQTVADIRRIYADEPLAQPIRGYASRYSWPSRSVLLLPEADAGGLRVRGIGFGAGVPYQGPGEGSGRNTDPMVALLPSRDDKGEPYPYRLRRDRLLWRDLSALLPGVADTVAEGKGGKLKVKPGRPAEVLLHAARVMRLVQATAQDGKMPTARPAQPVVPVQVFGQLTDQGKAFAIRQESYTLPEAFVEHPEHFRDHVKQALDDAGTVGEALRRSVSLLAQNLLKKDGSRSPDPGDIRKLAEQIPAAPTYWQALETPFRVFLLELDSDPLSALQGWHAALRSAALGGWRVAEQAAGTGAVGLRAVQRSQATLLGALGTLLSPQHQGGNNDPSKG